MYNKDIEEAFDALRENYTVAKSINFFNNINRFSDKVLFENSSLFLYEPFRGVSNSLEILSRYPYTKDELNTHLSECIQVLNDCKENSSNEDHVKLVESYVKLVKSLSKENENVRESAILDINMKHFEDLPESYHTTFIKPIQEAFKFKNNKYIKALEEFYDESHLAKCSDVDVLFDVFPSILNYITNMVITRAKIEYEDMLRHKHHHDDPVTKAEVPDKDLELENHIIYLPKSIIAFMTKQGRVSEECAHVLMRLIDNAIAKVAAIMNECGSYRLEEYIYNLNHCRTMIFRTMAREVNKPEIAEEDEGACESAIFTPTFEGVDMGDISESYLRLLYEEAYVTFATNPDDDIDQLYEDFIRLENLRIALEGNPVKTVSDAIYRGSRTAKSKATKAIGTVKQSVSSIAKVAKNSEDNADEVINNVKQLDYDERRERIIKGGFMRKLKKIIRDGILYAALWQVKPVIGAIVFLGRTAIDKNADNNTRRDILTELEGELRITEEKISDAQSKGDNKAKYNLMRIKNQLEREIERIKSGLPATTSKRSPTVASAVNKKEIEV